ncbi:LOW QUALITY PROTEIN: Lipase 1 [Paramyrothecium foliicola]|nr:LOW QUALITY PROTEIN: Lipase 1 [Paramyrothecium foliicola]
MKKTMLRNSLLGLTVFALGASCAGARLSTVVTTNGTVVGVADEASGVQKFLGIPFAEAPVGDLRLAHAVPLKEGFGTLQANKFGPACATKRGGVESSEDCLTLNLWRPLGAGKSNTTLPVLVYLYGGGLTGGDSAKPETDATAMVRISHEIGKPIIVVAPNYRVGPFGFLNGKEMEELGLLNLGMLDQRLALHWLQDNIGAFGGDPKKITLSGQSAGAVSTYSHMMAYGGRDDGLFRGAILQSGGAFPLTPPDTEVFQSTFDSLLTETECSDFVNGTAEEKVECIRQLPLDVFKAKSGPDTGQSIDGDFSRTSIQTALAKGEYVKVATIVGSNTDEGTTSAPKGTKTVQDVADAVREGFARPRPLPNKTVSALLELYPTDPRLGCPYNTGYISITNGEFDKLACSVFGDIVQVGPARMIAQSLASDGVPVYRYRFNHLPWNSSDVSRGISTGFEKRYVFSNPLTDHPWDVNFAYEVSSAWISFVHDLDPSTGPVGLPKWPQYGKEGLSIVLNGYGSWIEEDNYRAEGIKFIIDEVLPDGAS